MGRRKTSPGKSAGMADKIKTKGECAMNVIELRKLTELLEKIEWRTINTMGYRCISGGFATAEVRKINRKMVTVMLKHGVSSDCERRVYKDTLYIDRNTMKITA